jgi:NADPH:quinone reductase-like Zn-dependent oxidoreductase
MEHHQRSASPLSNGWLSLMAGASSMDEDITRRPPPQVSRTSSRSQHRQSYPQDINNHHGSARSRSPARPDITRSRPRTPTISPSTSWWSGLLTENLSDDFEVFSLDAIEELEDRKKRAQSRVRFDNTADFTKTRDVVVPRTATEKILDLISDRVCSFDYDLPTMDSIEKAPVLRFLDPDLQVSSQESEESASTGTDCPLSPMSTQSEDALSLEVTPQNYSIISSDQSASTESKRKYKDLLKSKAVERRLERREQILQSAQNVMGRTTSTRKEEKEKGFKALVSQTSASIWNPTTKNTDSMSDNGHKKRTAVQKAVTEASSFQSMTTSFIETLRGSRSYGSEKQESRLDLRDPHQLTASQTKEDVSLKENGLPLTVKVPTESTKQGAVWIGIPNVASGFSEDRQIPNREGVALLEDERATKICTIPPLLRKRIHMLTRLHTDKKNKQLTAQKTLSSEASSTMSEMMILKTLDIQNLAAPTKQKSRFPIVSSRTPLRNSNAAVITTKGPASTFQLPTDTSVHKSRMNISVSSEYNMEDRRHAYIAYFERGEAARKALRLYEHPAPPRFPTTASEIVVKIEMSTVSESDCAVRKGIYWGEGTSKPLNLPIVPGVSFCGKIFQMDKSALRSGFKLDDRVVSLVRVGANSRHLCIKHDRVVKVPLCLVQVPPESIACLSEVYLTAFQALHVDQKNGVRYRKNSLDGKSILILGGATVIGKALIELSVTAGAGIVYSTVQSNQARIVEEVGGIALDRDPHHWYSLLAGKMDMCICVDSFRKHSEFKYEHIQTLNKKGTMVLLKGPEEETENVVTLDKVDEQSIGTSRKLYNYNVFRQWDADLKQGKRDLAHLLRLLGDEAICPKVIKKIQLKQVSRAHDILESNLVSGFILCDPWLTGERSRPGSVCSTRSKKSASSKASLTSPLVHRK